MDQSIKTKMLDISQIRLNPKNPRTIKDDKFKKLCKSLKANPEFLDARPIVVKGGIVYGGNMRWLALKEIGIEIKPEWIKDVTGWTDEAIRKFIVVDNIAYGDNDWDELANQYQKEELEDWGMDVDKWSGDEVERYSLAERFLIPPFSVLDARLGDWQNRKREWLSLGIKSELGRDENLSGATEKTSYQSGTNSHVAPSTSIFDPVLCEIAYTWFNVTGGSVLDPFAGGSVRGIVSEKLGHSYTGIDLATEQINENNEQAKLIGVSPKWIVGDSNEELDKVTDQYDMIFTCPPYADLEVYSNNPKDISNMKYDDFLTVYRSIIAKACTKLKNNRFAVVVVGEVRDKKGNYYDFLGDTIKAFIDAGLNYYNEMILVTANGTAGMRANRSFQSGRKVVKTHQNVLVFYKGDNKKIRENYGDVEVQELPSEGGESNG